MNHQVSLKPSNKNHYQQLIKSQLVSVGISLPSNRVKSDQLFEEINSETQYGTPTNWMSERMGIVERRMADAAAKPSDLAIPAAEQAIANAVDINPDHIDMVVFCGIERDHPEPATAHTIQDALGLNAKFTFDLANACFGFVNGMEMASHYIQSRAVRYALICTGETPSKVLRAVLSELKKGVDIKTFRNKLGALSVGDAGGAVIMGPSDYGQGFQLFNTQSISSHVEKCIYRWLPNGTVEGQMQMGPIVNAIINAHKDLIEDTLEQLGWSKFDWLLTHQMGAKPFEKFRQLNRINPERMIKTFDYLGNITSATLPVNYHKLLNSGELRKGDRIGGCFAGSGLAIGQFGYTV